MRRSTLSIALACATIAATTAAAARTAPAKQVLTFQEPRPQLVEDDLPPKSKSTLSLGDRLTISGLLENKAHQRLGTFGGTCTVIGSGNSFITTPLLCHAVYQLANGQIEATGMMSLSKTTLVIIGGTGPYQDIHGSVTSGKIAKGFDDADKLTIER